MKRHLNKIIFIKSADIDYLEIMLNGNVHFTGDQGVGKSTVLRAILFFYNARTDKLGINPGDENFLEFYFKFPNSYIIYEVQSEHNKYLVWLSKENNRPAYRFVDHQYNKNLFFENTTKGFRPLLINEVKEKIAEKQIQISPKIFQFKEFRNILYGSNKKNKFRPYNLLQSSAYQNVPNTISNIFLNAQLDSDKIKRTIIQSLIGEEQNIYKQKYQIDLTTIRKGIKEFEQDFNDIADFRKTELKAKKIIDISEDFKQKEHDKLITAQNLGESYLFFEKNKIEVEDKYKKLNQQIQELDKKIKEIKESHAKNEKKINDIIVVLKNKIEEANEKNKYWKNIKINDDLIGIEAILKQIAREKSLQNSRQKNEDELKTLKTKFESTEQKYNILFQQIKNEKETNINLYNKEYSSFQNQTIEDKEKINDLFENKQNNLSDDYEKNTEKLNNQKEILLNTFSELKRKKDLIQNKEFYKPDIDEIQKLISDNEKSIIGNTKQIEIEKNKINTIREKAESEKNLLNNEYETKRKEKTLEYEKIENKIDKIDKDLQSYENSFYKYLHKNYPGWENNIAKVCNEKILFAENLNPRLINKKSNTLYGIELNLSDTEKSIKTIQEYHADKTQLDNKRKKIKKEITTLDTRFEKEKTSFVKARNKKIANLKKIIMKHETENTKLLNLKDKSEIRISDIQQKAKEEKKQQLSELNIKILNKEKQLIEIENKISEQKTKRDKQKEKLRTDKQNKLQKLNSKLKQKNKLKEQKIEDAKKKYADEKQKLENEKLKELDGKGADTEKIKVISNKIEKLNKQLQFISELNKKYVAKYYIEKEEIDKLPEYINKKQEQEQALTELKSKHKAKIQKLETKLKHLQDEFEKIKETKKAIEIDLNKFEQFTQNEIYKNLEYYIIKADTPQNNGKLDEIIGTLTNLIFKTNTLNKKLKKQTDEFVSPFREDNIFNFRKQFIEDNDYLDFSDNLKEYIEEQKIEDVKRQVKKKHTGLLEQIITDINLLASKRKDIDKTIAEINKDFKKSNFVSVIQEFEMETKDTANSIVQVLFEIKKFHDSNPFDIGKQPNLFSGKKMEENKQKSIQLLTILLKNLNINTKQQEINLEDIFELKFRAKQNNKNTGWKSKLSDVGSHGTDILLKAMIYIMLLNVFKEKAVKKTKSKNFILHCIMDEIGRIHSKNVKGLIEFAGSRNIWVIFGSPEENDALAYKYVYNFEKQENITTATRLIYDKRK